uniref:FH2 domain-containing protein n=1 Tax=Panagrolaimus superbus TaxID=310955 RepID=A0A914Z2W5_9BILA
MVSLHGITGDPISYMDEYAEQVEEFMKKCFPNEEAVAADNETLLLKEETPSSFVRDFFTPSLASEKSEIIASLPNSLIENEQALYTNFPHRFVCSTQIKGTVFETFTNSSDLIDRIDLTEMAVFFENNNRSLLNSDQIRIVSEVRRQLPKKDFEIMFALYKCDTSLLSLAQINLIKLIAPSEVDARRFKTFCEANSVSSLSEEEKFVIELSNIEQLFIRLRLMETIHTFPEMVYNLQQEINILRDVAITLRADTFFTIILQCSTIYTNFLCGDFGAQLIHGIRVIEALNVCKYELPNGIKIGKRIADMLPINALGDTVAKRLKLYQEASQYNFSTLETRVKKLGECLLQLDAERSNLGTDCAPSSVGIVVQEARLRESLTTAQNEMTTTLQYFAESSSTSATIKPENFIKNVTELLQFLINVC